MKELKTLVSSFPSLVSHVERRQQVKALSREADAISDDGLDRRQRSELLMRWLDLPIKASAVITKRLLAAIGDAVASVQADMVGRGDICASRRPTELKDVGEGAVEPAKRARSEDAGQVLRLRERKGGTLVCPFLVENRFSDVQDVSFLAQDLVATTARTLPASFVSFDPASVSLRPRSGVVANARIRLSEEFVIGETYQTALQALGFRAEPVRLAITVLPPAPLYSAATPTDPSQWMVSAGVS